MTKNLQTSQNIVEASFKLMAEHGIEKMSLSMIAKEGRYFKTGYLLSFFF